MKKTVLIFTVILLTYNINYSQETNQDTKFVRIGLKVAPSVAWMKPNSTTYTNNGSKFGFSYGLMTDFFFSENYGISTGIDVSYGGGKLGFKGAVSGDTLRDSKFKLQYIEIPVTLKMKTNKIGNISYYAQFGFGVSVKLKAKEDWIYSGANAPLANNGQSGADVIKDLNLFRGSFIVGLGGEYSLTGTTKFLAGIYFNNGLTHVLNSKSRESKSDAINNSIGISVGILF